MAVDCAPKVSALVIGATFNLISSRSTRGRQIEMSFVLPVVGAMAIA